jgi:hypothetical protein
VWQGCRSKERQPCGSGEGSGFCQRLSRHMPPVRTALSAIPRSH